MNEQKKMVEVIDISKTFHIGFLRKKVQAVRGVSFNVEEGEVFGLLGPNGAGKTTTLKMMMGLIRIDQGSIRLLGRDASEHQSRQQIGYLPENPYFHEYLTPRELLTFYGRLCNLSSAQIASRRDSLIERVGLKEAANRPLRKFSKGMLQRIGIAQALISEPAFLILDEPMSGLDPIGRKFVVDLMMELKKNGVTILFSSHILSDVERLCDRVVILNHGRKVSEGRLVDLLKTDTGETKTLEELFVEKAMEIVS